MRCSRAFVGFVAWAGLVAPIFTPAHAGLEPITIVQMIDRSDVITAGTVLSVRDGYDDDRIPYTEITLNVEHSLKGATSGTFTFRQFGLMTPRQSDSGNWDLNVTPQEWPTFHESETVLLFLFKEAAHTSFRAPIGLDQGAFRIIDEHVVNEFANAGLFRNVQVEPGLLDAEEEALLSADGPLPLTTLLGFVRRAVDEEWVETGRLNHVQP